MAPVLAIADMVADRRRRPTTIVTPLERLSHPSQPGRTWSDSHQEDRHGRDTLKWAESEAAKRIGEAAAGRGPAPERDASARGRNRRGQQRALRRRPSGSRSAVGSPVRVFHGRLASFGGLVTALWSDHGGDAVDRRLL